MRVNKGANMDRSTPRIEPLEARIAPAGIQGLGNGIVIQKLGSDYQSNATNGNVQGNQLNLINVTDGDGIAYDLNDGFITLTGTEPPQPTRSGGLVELGTLRAPITINLAPELGLDLGLDLLRGNERLAFADMNGDGVEDTIAVNPGGTGLIRVIDGKTNQLFEGVFSGLRPFSSSAGGATVAVGDINNDGRADIVVGSDSGNRVKVFDGRDGSLMDSFKPFVATYRGGVNVAVGDLNGDGVAEIIVGLSSGGTKVKVFAGPDSELIASFKAGTGPRGVQVSVSDVDTDGVAEIVAKYGRKNAPITKYFSAEDIFQPLQVSENHQTIASINRIDVQRFQGAPSGFTVNYEQRSLSSGSWEMQRNFSRMDAPLIVDHAEPEPIYIEEVPYDETADVTGGSAPLGFSKSSGGTLTISESNTFYSGQTINGGSFSLGSGTMGAGTLTVAGGVSSFLSQSIDRESTGLSFWNNPFGSAGTLTMAGLASHSLAKTIQINGPGFTLLDNPFLSSGVVSVDGGTRTFEEGSINPGQSEGTISPTLTPEGTYPTLGTLTLTANSSIVFGSSGEANRLIFRDFTSNGFTLRVYGWNGMIYSPDETIDHGPAPDSSDRIDRLLKLSSPE